MEFRTFDLNQRAPTSFERAFEQGLQEAGVADVYIEPAEAPQAFWETILQATGAQYNPEAPFWNIWAREIRWAFGWPDFQYTSWTTYGEILRTGNVHHLTSKESLGPAARMSAVEHFLDLFSGSSLHDMTEQINDRARRFRVGVRVERQRFVPLAAEHLHQEVVRPALLLLSDPALEPVDALYRKAFNRALSNDTSGAITAATSAVEEMLRIGLGVSGSRLEPLVTKARQAGWLTASTAALIPKISALRDDSDAHTAGTSEFQLALFALHLTGTILLHLGRTLPLGRL